MNAESDRDLLLAEQRAYYSALAPDFFSQFLDLPGGDEANVAVAEFRPAGSAIAASRVPADAPVRFVAADHYRTPEELIEGAASSTIERRTPDGTGYRIVKVAHEPADLERRLRGLGWDITVTPTAGPFYWGAGRRAQAVH